MRFIDTNILVYAASTQDLRKRARAAALLKELFASASGVVSWQVLREFANVLFKKSGLPADAIKRIVAGFSVFPCVGDSPEILMRGIEIKTRYGLQFFDALIVASAEAAHCTEIYSEDMGDGQVYGGIRVVNPFRAECRD